MLSGSLLFSGACLAADSAFTSNLNNTAGNIGYGTTANLNNANSLLYLKIGSVLRLATTFVGVFFFGLMIYAGYTWMMARGNEQAVEKAKNIMTTAVIGLVVILGAYVITQVFSNLWTSVKS